MKIINKKNIVSVVCITYTSISITLAVLEVIAKGKMNPTQLNMFLCLLLSILGVLILSQHYRLERFSPLAMVIIQYVIAVAVILISLKAASYITDIHPDGYRDMILSFSIPYFIGAVVYYISLMLEVRKQNRILENIKKDRK